MPRSRKAPLFELGGSWIAREPGRDGFWRFWNDPGAGRVRRSRLAADDLEAAKIELARLVVTAGEKTPDSLLAAVLAAYHEARTDHLPSAKAARIASRKVLAFLRPGATVADWTEARVKAFAAAEIGAGLSHAYVSRTLSVIAAAFRHARLTPPPYSLAWVHAAVPGGKAPRRVPIPTDAEIARLLSAPVPEPLFRWMLISLATGCRPEAALDLGPDQRRDGLLDLNPPGRKQTKKWRPIVREPGALTAALNAWDAPGEAEGRPGRYVAYASVESVQTALQRASEGLGIKVSAYSLRHKVTSVLRRAKREGVTEDGIAAQIGHKRANVRVTSGYGEFDPDYLDAESRALDRWLQGLGYSRRNPANQNEREARSGRFIRKSWA
jgi:integrase